MWHNDSRNRDVIKERALMAETGLEKAWQLWRQDGNGNRFLVAEFENKESAETRMMELTRCQHQQTYWICRGGSSLSTAV